MDTAYAPHLNGGQTFMINVGVDCLTADPKLNRYFSNTQ